MIRDSFDQSLTRPDGPWTIIDRFANSEIELSRAEFDDLCRVQLSDWLEQVPRSQTWDYRPAAFRQMAERLGGVALDSYQKVYGEQAVGAPV